MPDRRSRAQRINTPLGRALRYLGLLVGIVAGWELGHMIGPEGSAIERQGYAILFAATLGALFFLATPYVTIGFFSWLHQEIRRLSLFDLIVIGIGLLAGGLVSALLAWPISLLPGAYGQILPTAAAIVISGLTVIALLAKKREMQTMIMRRDIVSHNGRVSGGEPSESILLDTSVIIDGRIADLARTGFIMAELIVPQFVLRELQLVADSSDLSRRDRGHRGLDVLDKLQHDDDVRLIITDLDTPDEVDVDNKLVRVARTHRFRILTGDQNLERIATLQGVRVLNIHQLAHVLRPPLIPGEEMLLKIVQPGREYGQGVGYLNDGTMVVVESGKSLIGQDVKVVVTRTLQTGAGRMAFAQVVGVETV